MKPSAQTFWSVGDAYFGYQTEDGIEAYPFQAMNIESLIPASDESITYDVSSLLSLSHTIEIQLTPHQSWDLRCMLERWKTDFTCRNGWNKRILK